MVDTKRQSEAIEILRNKIAKDPNNPKVAKWKAIISNTEREIANAKMTESIGNRARLTPKAQQIMDAPLADSEQTRIRKEYLHTVIYPDDYAYRVPDELTQPTVLYKSLREFNLVANLDGSKDSGRFSIAVKPILGGINNPHNFQCGIVDNTAGWPKNPLDFSKSSSYLSSNLFTDPRVDPMIAPLTNGPLGYNFITVQYNTISPGNSLYYSMIIDPTQTHFSQEGTLPTSYVQLPTNNPPGIGFQFNYLGSSYTIVNDNQNSGPYGFSVATGTYLYHPQVVSIGSWTINYAYEITTWIFDENFVAVGYIQSTPTSNTESGVAAGHTNHLYGFDGIVYNMNQALFAEDDYTAHMFSKYIYVPTFNTNGMMSSVTFLTSIAATSDPKFPVVTDSGSVIKMRPIGLSCLVTCTLPEINAGGNIVAYSAPSSDIDNYYYKQSSQLGPFQDWENLARVNKATLIHDGNFKDGCYVWSQAWDKNDMLMRTPTEMNDYEYQGIIVSGQLSPSLALHGLVNCGRIRIAIIYEYTTDNRLFNPESCIGTTADLDWVLGFLGTQRHASENSDHLKKLKEIARKSATLITKSVPYVIKGASTAGKIASMFV